MVYGHPRTDIHTNVYANTVNTSVEWRPRPLGRSGGRVMNGKCIHTPSPDQTLPTTQRKAVASTSPVLCLKEYPSGTLARGPWRERVFRERSEKAENMRVCMRGPTRDVAAVSRGNGHAPRGNGRLDAGSEAGGSLKFCLRDSPLLCSK